MESTKSEEHSLADLPPEVLLRLLSHYGLSARQLSLCAATCHLFMQTMEVDKGGIRTLLSLTELAAMESCFKDSLFNCISKDCQKRLRQRCRWSWKLILHYLEMLSATQGQKWGQVIACRDFSFVVKPNGSLFSFGCGADYRLGNGGTDNIWHPQIVSSLRNVTVRHMSAGPQHTVLCTDEGKVYTFGLDQWGCCGHGDDSVGEVVKEPKLVEKLTGFSVVQVACGYDFTAVLTKEGEVVTFGSNRRGCLGHGIVHDETIPRRIEILREERVTQIAAGLHHLLAVTEKGQLYTWGEGRNGKLGHGTWDSQPRPKRVDRLTEIGCHVVSVSGGIDISVALSACGEVFTWGWGCSGRLGHGGYGDSMFPQRVKGLDGVRIVQIGAGSKRTFAISDSGHMFTFGWAAKQALELLSFSAVQASMGSGHTLVLTKNGSVLSYGVGERGQLGFTSSNESMYEVVPSYVPNL